jgi:hypothetical protein
MECFFEINADGFYKCKNCHHIWPKKLEKKPRSNCAKPPRVLILEYLESHPGSTQEQICQGLDKTCESGKATVKFWVDGMVISGEIVLGADCQGYSLPAP